MYFQCLHILSATCTHKYWDNKHIYIHIHTQFLVQLHISAQCSIFCQKLFIWSQQLEIIHWQFYIKPCFIKENLFTYPFVYSLNIDDLTTLSRDLQSESLEKCMCKPRTPKLTQLIKQFPGLGKSQFNVLPKASQHCLHGPHNLLVDKAYDLSE